MIRPLLVAWGLAAAAFTSPRHVASQVSAADLAIRGVNVVDVETGTVLPDRTVLIRGNRIVAVDAGSGAGIAAGTHVVDGRGRYLIPGLWDMHGHVLNRWSWGAPLFVANGVTGVRDMATWTPLADVRRLRDALHAGRQIGPRFVTGGPLIDGEPALFDDYLAVGTADRARHVVDSLHAAGAEFIKVYTHLQRAVFDAIVERSQHHGLPFTGHVPLALTTAEASDVGMRSVEHVYRHRLACATAEPEIRRLLMQELEAQRRRDPVARQLADSAFHLGMDTYDAQLCEELGRRFARNGTWFVPTLVEMRSRFLPEPRSWEEFDSLFTQSRLAYMPRHIVASWRDEEQYQRGMRAHGISSRDEYERVVRDRAREVETRLRMVGDLHRGGVGILAGTDAAVAFPLVMLGYSVHEELELLVQAGLTPVEALRAGTLNAARYLQATDSLGTIAPGKIADLVLLDANPLEDIGNTTRIRAVVLNGRLLDRAALDAQLEAARRAALEVTPAPRVEEASTDQPREEVLFASSPPVWFEGFGAPALVRPDGRNAIVGSTDSGDLRVVAIPGGEPVLDLTDAGVADTRGAIFGPSGRVALWGTVGDRSGWFALEPGGPRPLALPPGGVPHWSPDGESVVLSRPAAAGGGLTVLSGGRERIVLIDGGVLGYGWAPDGRSILVLTTDTLGVSDLHRVTADTGDVETLVRGLDATWSPAPLAISSDGRRAYLALASAGAPEPADRHKPVTDRDLDIYEVDLGTGTRRVVVATPADDFAPAVVDGHLYWTSSSVEQSVVVVPAAGGPARIVVEGAQLPTWRPDGRAIGFTFGDWRRADWVLGWDGGVVELAADATPVAPPRPYITGYHEDFSPVWSPDGSWIAYHSHRSAGPAVRYAGPGITDDIYLRREGSTEEIRLTAFGRELGSPSWAPDGTRLVYTGAAADFDHDAAWITTLDPATGRALEHRRLELPDSIGEVTDAAWSPVAEEIAVAAPIRDGRRGLWTVRPDGSVISKVAEYAMGTFGGVDWTPDGRSIVFPAITDGRMQLFTIPAEGGEPRQLTRENANLLHPRVSPDGRWIAATRIVHRRELRRIAQ